MSSRARALVIVTLVVAVGPAAAAPPGPPPDLTRPNPNEAAVAAIAATITAPSAADLEARLAPAVRVTRRVGCRGVGATARGRQRAKLAACLRARLAPIAGGMQVATVRGRQRIRARVEFHGTPAEVDPTLVLELRPGTDGLLIVGVDWIAPRVTKR